VLQTTSPWPGESAVAATASRSRKAKAPPAGPGDPPQAAARQTKSANWSRMSIMSSSAPPSRTARAAAARRRPGNADNSKPGTRGSHKRAQARTVQCPNRTRGRLVSGELNRWKAKCKSADPTPLERCGNADLLHHVAALVDDLEVDAPAPPRSGYAAGGGELRIARH